MTDEEAESVSEVVERLARAERHRALVRAESERLAEALLMHVRMAISSGTDPARVLAYLVDVRDAVLMPRRYWGPEKEGQA